MLTLLIAVSCNTPPAASSQKLYFDLSGFFDQQVETLYKDSFIVLKTSSINNNTDQHEMPWTDWRKELALFYASDINKTALMGKYVIDTLMIDSTEKKVTYQSTDSTLRTRLLEITYSLPENAVQLLHISNQSYNIISSNREELYYEPVKTYIIKSTQKMKFFGENTFAVKGDIVQKQRAYF
ncbi:MAG: hypothetical protein ABIO46_13220 [Chitinophagales bacterium]